MSSHNNGFALGQSHAASGKGPLNTHGWNSQAAQGYNAGFKSGK